MNNAMRRELARQPFEEKIRKVGQLIRLSAALKSSRMREDAPMTNDIARPAVDIAEPSSKREDRPNRQLIDP